MSGTRRFWALVGLGMTITCAAWAQGDGRLAGRLTKPDGSALSGVSVVVSTAGLATISDSNGAWSLDHVPAGTVAVGFTAGEYSETVADVAVAAGATTRVDRAFDWQLSYAETITVFSASRHTERITEAPAAVTLLDERQIERGTGTGQVPKLLEGAPGVDFTQSGLYDFNFNVRGFNSSLNRRILTLIDGRDPSVPFLGAQEWAAMSVPVEELSSVELVRGPGSALYGANAFNGVLNMVSTPPRYATGGKVTLTGGELSTLRADVRQAGGFGDGWYYRLLGGYLQGDDFTRSRNVQTEYSKFCTSASQTNCLRREARGLAEDHAEIAYGSLRLDRYFEAGPVVTVEGGTADLSGPTFVTGIGRVQVTDTQRPWARVNFNSTHWNALGYYDTRKAEKQVALASGALLFEDSSNLHGELQGNAEFAGDKGRLVGGLSYHEQSIDTSDRSGFHTLMAESKKEHSQALFGQVDYDLTDSFKAVVALRWDDSTLHDPQYSPKASLVWGMTRNHTLRLTYNKAFQVPNYSEFFLRAPAGAPITAFAPLENALAPLLGGQTLGLRSIPITALGNANLDVEKIRSYELGYAGVVGGKLFLSLDYYQNRVENFVTDLLPGVNPAFAGYSPPAFLPASVRAQILATLSGGLGANFVGLTSINGQPTLVLSYANSGVVDTQGVELAFNYYLNPSWTIDGSYSWFDFEVKKKNERDQLLPNAPENKASLGVAWHRDRFDVALQYRWVDSFLWAAGVFVGDVPSYQVFNLQGSVDLTPRVRLGLNVSNLLDDSHWESFGGDLMSRRALAWLSFGW